MSSQADTEKGGQVPCQRDLKFISVYKFNFEATIKPDPLREMTLYSDGDGVVTPNMLPWPWKLFLVGSPLANWSLVRDLLHVCVGGLHTVLGLEPNYCMPSSFKEVPVETGAGPVSGYSRSSGCWLLSFPLYFRMWPLFFCELQRGRFLVSSFSLVPGFGNRQGPGTLCNVQCNETVSLHLIRPRDQARG